MAIRDGMFAVGPHRVRGGTIPATVASVRWEGHPHIEHGAGAWTQGSTKATPTTTGNVGADCRTGGGSRCRSAVWGSHHFFTPSMICMYSLVRGQELAPAPLGSKQEETGHQPTTPTTPPSPQRRGTCIGSYFLHIVCLPFFFQAWRSPAEKTQSLLTLRGSPKDGRYVHFPMLYKKP